MERAGGMVLFWNIEVKVVQVQHTAFTIEAHIEDQINNCDWWMIGIYASCDDSIRRQQWSVIQRRKHLWGSNWMIAGDFNDIFSNEEKWGGRTREEWTFNDIRTFINENQLVDTGYEGQPWTWSNNWEGNGEIKQRLDRTLSSAQ